MRLLRLLRRLQLALEQSRRHLSRSSLLEGDLLRMPGLPWWAWRSPDTLLEALIRWQDALGWNAAHDRRAWRHRLHLAGCHGHALHGRSDHTWSHRSCSRR